MPLASRHVIRIEEIRKGGMRRAIPRRGRGQNKGFEKPARMRQMPLGGAHIRHGLDDVVFRHQRLAEPIGELSHLTVTLDKSILVNGITNIGEGGGAMNT